MSKTTIRIRKVCPACDGRGKSYGSRYCGACRGRHKVTETVTIETEGETAPAHDSQQRIAEATDKLLRELGVER